MMTLRSSRASPPLHNNPRQPLRGRAGGAGALGRDTPPSPNLPAGERRHGQQGRARLGGGAPATAGAGRRSPAPLAAARGLARAVASAPHRPPAGKRRKWRVRFLVWFVWFLIQRLRSFRIPRTQLSARLAGAQPRGSGLPAGRVGRPRGLSLIHPLRGL